MSNKSIVLIGMPGAGKSTLGVLLAKRLALPFVDTDLLLQSRLGMSLQDYLDKHGYQSLRKKEEEVLLEAPLSGSVVATGGSVVYSDAGMRRLGELGRRVYLKISVQTMIERIGQALDRGLACAPGTSMTALFQERSNLYERYADLVVDLEGVSFDQSLDVIVTLLLPKRPEKPL